MNTGTGVSALMEISAANSSTSVANKNKKISEE